MIRISQFKRIALGVNERAKDAMAYIVLALGALLSIGGALSIYTGAGIVEVERGWTGVIAGATALSGGIVTIAIGLAIKALLDLRAVLVSQSVQPAALPVPVDVRHDFATPVPADMIAPPQAAPPSLFTPELESSLLAAMTASHEPSHQTADHDHHEGGQPPQSVAPESPAREISGLGAPQEVSAYDVIAAARENDDAPDIFVPPSESPPPVEPMAETRPRLTLRGRPVTEPVPASPEPATDEHPVPEEPAHEQPEPVASHAAIEPPSMETPGTDDWLDRAFSAIDGEGFRHEAHGLDDRHAVDGLYETGASQEHGIEAHADETPQAVTVLDATPAEPDHPAQTDPHGAAEPHEPSHPAPHAEAPAVIGRYEADGTSYVMYADGSIEAHSDLGVERFASMADLKAFIEAAA